MNGKQPAGWYPHPSMAETIGYWDGERWTGQVAPAPKPAARDNRMPGQVLPTPVIVTLVILFTLAAFVFLLLL